MKIDLLGRRDAIAAAGIEEVARSAMEVVIADIFDEEKSVLADLALDHEGRFSGELVDRVRRREKIREHAADAPAATQFPRPRKLYIWLHAGTRDGLGAGRQSGANHCREIDLSRNWADLPFDRWCDVGEARIHRPGYGSEVGRDVDQNLQAGCDTPAQSAVGAIEHVTAVPLAEIDAVLVFDADPRHHPAGNR